MIHHISIPARDPVAVAHVLAEMMGGKAYHFPGPCPGATMALSRDPHGTMIEVYPESAVLTPGQADDEQVAFGQVPEAGVSHSAFHAFLSVPHDRSTVERIGQAAGWRTRYFSRAAPGRPPVFHLIEVWVENRIMLEVVPADMIGVYEAFMQVDRMDAMGLALEA
jgi:hypothetical protein